MSAVVSLRDARRYYETKAGTVKALDGVTLDIAAGDFVVLAGPSGSGKTTLVNLIGALDKPTDGEVSIDGRSLATLSAQALADLRRDRIGFVFQAYNLVPVLTVLENVEYVMLLQGVAADERRRRAMAVLSEVGLGELVGRRPDALSGGQQQRVAVARALAAGPALVLADEPTANLDSATSEGLMDLMGRLNATHGTTFVCCTHDPALMARARRLVRLRDGRVESDARPAP
ncbi:MAG: ABC transporter ATP-binding protein [Myxococcales bacterium]|nr:ABC transporter ATP-binding protein [Myxococcales bacterium]